MAFTQQANITITSIGDVSINLFVPAPGSLEPQSGTIDIQLVMSDGSIKVINADLLARLADDAAGLVHRTNLLALKDYLKTRIIAEVLP